MNNTLSTVVGLDEVINRFQVDLYDSLVNKLPSLSVEGYGRVYKNKNIEGGITPEWWDENTGNYKELFLNSSLDLTFFYLENGNHTSDDGSFFIAPLKLVFIFNLKKLRTPHRADAEAQKIVTSSIHVDTYVDFIITEIEKGIESVFSGLDMSKITFDDIHPFHIFSVNGTLGYYLPKN